MKKYALFMAVPLLINISSVLGMHIDNLMETIYRGAVNEYEDFGIKKVAEILDSGIDINSKDKDGRTAFRHATTCASISRNFNMMQFLWEKGADVNISDNDGDSALAYAIKLDDDEMLIKKLIEMGANVNFKKQGDVSTILMHACMFRSFDVVKMLLYAGARTDLDKDRYGNSGFGYLMTARDTWQKKALICIPQVAQIHQKLHENQDKNYLMMLLRDLLPQLQNYLYEQKYREITNKSQ